MTKASEISVAEVVDEEDDDVWLFSGLFFGETKSGVQAGGDSARASVFEEVTSTGWAHRERRVQRGAEGTEIMRLKGARFNGDNTSNRYLSRKL